MLGRKKVDYRRKTTVWNARRLSWELKEVHSEETEPQPGKSFLCLPKMNHDTCERKERNGAPGLQRLLILQLMPLALLWAVSISESCSQRCHGTVSERKREACLKWAELSKLMLQENQPAAPCPESGHWFIIPGQMANVFLLEKVHIHGNMSSSPLKKKLENILYLSHWFKNVSRTWNVAQSVLPWVAERALPGRVSQHSMKINSSLKHHVERLKSL